MCFIYLKTIFCMLQITKDQIILCSKICISQKLYASEHRANSSKMPHSALRKQHFFFIFYLFCIKYGIRKSAYI